jgi:hypothetical protein
VEDVGDVEEDVLHALALLTREARDAEAMLACGAAALAGPLEVAAADAAPPCGEVLVDLGVGADVDRELRRGARARTRGAAEARAAEPTRADRRDGDQDDRAEKEPEQTLSGARDGDERLHDHRERQNAAGGERDRAVRLEPADVEHAVENPGDEVADEIDRRRTEGRAGQQEEEADDEERQDVLEVVPVRAPDALHLLVDARPRGESLHTVVLG